MRSYHNTVTQKGRIPIVVGVFTLATFAIIARLGYLQVVKHDEYFKLASMQHMNKDIIPAKRGEIYANDSLSNTPYILAANEELDLVYVDPKETKDKDKVASVLSTVLGKDKKEIFDMINVDSSYVLIARKLSKEKSDAIRSEKLAGVGFTTENWRTYPEGSLAASVLGFVNGEQVGNYGLEEYFNNELSGTPGQLKEETDIAGVKIAFGNNVLKEPKNGDKIYLTIDRYIQGKAEQLLGDTLKKFSARSGSLAVMDPKTGKILAMATGPTFDPNKYSEIKDYNLFKNQMVDGVYEPGSIFKVITLGAGLDAGKITPDTKFNDTGKVVLNGNTIMNSDKKSHGEVTMTYVLEQSLNTGTTWVEQQLGKNSFYDYVKKFNFGNILGIELPGEVGGFVNKPDQLNDHGYATMSFGQSISTTPLQMLAAFSSVANKGKMMKPYIVDKIVSEKGKTTQTEQKEITTVISEKAANDLAKMMVSVVERGHGTQAKVKGYKVAGKTGTAQIVRADGRGYETGKNIGSFIGFAPAEEARFVVMAKVDEPQNVAWAESTAAPLVGQMLDFLLKYYQVPPTEK